MQSYAYRQLESSISVLLYEWVQTSRMSRRKGSGTFLGVLVSNNLKVGPQCNQAFQKANLMLGLLKRMIDNKTLHIMLSLYKSLVRPHVEYCVSAWSPHYIKDKDTSERIQHRFTRLIPGMQKLSYMERLAKLRLVIGQDRRSSAKKQNITSARSAI